MKVVTYGRVSGREQAETGTSLPDQGRRLGEWASRDGRVHVEHFSDPGRTGGTLDRPGLTALRERVAAGDITMVAVTKSDRLARDQLVQLTLADEFSRHGAAVTAIDEGLTTATAEGQLTGGVLGAVAQFERQRIAARTKTGRRAAAEEGRFVGSTPPFGYKVVGGQRDRRLAIDKRQAETVRVIYDELVLGRVQAKHVAAELNRRRLTPAKKPAWDAATLRRWAKDSTHIRIVAGTWEFDGIQVPIPPIITPGEAAVWATWAREARTVYPQRSPKDYLLSSVLVMPCGRRAMGRTAGKQQPTYSCRDRLSPGAVGHDECHNVSVSRSDLAVVNHVRDTLLDPAPLRAAAVGRGPALSPAAELARVQAELSALDTRIAEEVALLREVGLRREAMEVSLRPLKNEQDTLTARARGLRRKVAEEVAGLDSKRVRKAVASLQHDLGTQDPEVWRQVFELLHVVVRIEGHAECPECDGSGYQSNRGRGGRGFAPRCAHCLAGTQPRIHIEMDDVAALAVADGLAESG
ncbi:recombinase family protein [Ornithinimicrobium faecis]|uniref:recombinase family protein n=1 Tax=Ornithinimicrobium faecis TaxID=2934158 RepID=UPI0021176EB5|nr:recombinase family protein [Ornithinimicrobium sp. HY1745]